MFYDYVCVSFEHVVAGLGVGDVGIFGELGFIDSAELFVSEA
jgi:hypothetical protein